MKNFLDEISVPKIDTATSGAGSAVQIVVSAIADEFHKINQIDVSYNGGSVTGGAVTVKDDAGSTYWQADLGSRLLTPIPFPKGCFPDGVTVNKKATVSAAAVSGATCKLNVQYQ